MNKQRIFIISILFLSVIMFISEYTYGAIKPEVMYNQVPDKIVSDMKLIPKAPKIKVTTTKNTITIQISSKNKNIKGYEIEQAKDFLWLTKTVYILPKKKNLQKYSILTKNPKQYYIRVRAYTFINKQKYYSKYKIHKGEVKGTEELTYTALTGTKVNNCIRNDKRLDGYSVHEGACVDSQGNIYLAFIKDITSNMTGKINKKNKVKIAKLNKKGKIIKVSPNLRIGHVNGMCYDTKRKKIVLTRSAADDLHVTIMDPKTFEYSFKKVKGTVGINAFNDICYDERTNTFLLHGINSRGRTVITNSKFIVLLQYRLSTPQNQGAVTYSTTLKDKYGHQYYLQTHSHRQSTNNYIKITSVRSNKVIQTFKLPYKSEIENVWIYNDRLYCSVHKWLTTNKGQIKRTAIIFKLAGKRIKVK